MKKSIGWMAGCLGLGMLLMACGGSDSATGSTSGNGPTEASLVGKWNVTTVHNKGWETDAAGNKKDVDTVETYPAGINVVEYKSDKSFSTSLGGFAISGTWSIKGDSVVTITSILGFEVPSSSYAVISGNSGTFTTHEVDDQQDLVVTTSATKQ